MFLLNIRIISDASNDLLLFNIFRDWLYSSYVSYQIEIVSLHALRTERIRWTWKIVTILLWTNSELKQRKTNLGGSYSLEIGKLRSISETINNKTNEIIQLHSYTNLPYFLCIVGMTKPQYAPWYATYYCVIPFTIVRINTKNPKTIIISFIISSFPQDKFPHRTRLDISYSRYFLQMQIFVYTIYEWDEIEMHR